MYRAIFVFHYNRAKEVHEVCVLVQNYLLASHPSGRSSFFLSFLVLLVFLVFMVWLVLLRSRARYASISLVVR